MKDHSLRLRIFIAGSILVASIFVFCDLAHATWYYAHGNTGVIEDTAVVASQVHSGQGLDIDQNYATENWVHFPFVTPISDDLLDVVTLQIWKGAGATVDAVHIYDGRTRIAILDGPGVGSEVWTTVYVWLPAKKKINRGLGVSVQISSGGEGWQSHHVKFGAVGARFLPAS
jgi:hypothetical protein